MTSTDRMVLEAYNATHGGRHTIADATGLTPDTVRHALDRLRRDGEIDKPFERPELPSPLPSLSDLLEQRKQSFARLETAEDARSLIPVRVTIDGPIGIVHMGDPHVDDDGCDIATLEDHIKIINDTEGLFGANVGDQTNNWVGKLARLYGEQSTSAQEGWMLAEWLLTSVDWLYLCSGNHDAWQNGTEVMKWIMGQEMDTYGARLNLVFPNGKEVRINARHDFQGRSQWNPVHGPAKAAQMGWRDHVLVRGHTHTSGYNHLKDPSTGLISHCIRVGGYKTKDRYAKELGLPNQNISPAYVTVINPAYDDDDPRLVHVIADVETAAGYLTYLRNR